MSEVQSQSILYEDFDWRRKRIRLYADNSSYWSIERAFAGKPYRPLALGNVTIKGVVKVSAEVWLIHVFVHQQHEDRYDRILPRLATDLLVAADHRLPPELEVYNQPAPNEAAVLRPNGRTPNADSPGPAASGSVTPEADKSTPDPEENGQPASKCETEAARPAATPEGEYTLAPAAGTKAARAVPRGSLDDQAVTELKRNPAATYKQLAAALGCRPGTLRDKKKCPELAQARAILRAEREAFRGGSTWRDRRPNDDEA